MLRAARALAGLACLAVFVVTPLDLRSQAALAAASVGLGVLLARARRGPVTLALTVLSLTATARYLYWRTTATASAEWSVDAALGGLLLSAELYAGVMLLLTAVQSAAPLPRQPLALPEDVSLWPAVDVFIPTYDEPLHVVRSTVLAARALDWPAGRLRVHLLDDGRRESFRAFAAEAGVGYVTRSDNAHAKAGNLNHALSVTNGEYVAIFDCDHVPTRSFLQLTMGWLVHDPQLALVQTPHHFYSPDPFSRNLGTSGVVPAETELFYASIQPGIDTWNASFFCGSCAVLRRTALEDVDGIATETVTEDAHTALRMHRRGWRTAYLDVPQAAGLATETLSAHVGQRIRWARGMAQIFRVDNPLLGRGLTLPQRLSYLAAMLHFFSGIPRLIFLLGPIAYLGFGRHVFNALPLAALAYGLPHLALSTIASSRRHGTSRHSFWSDVYEACLAWYVAIPTTVALLAPKKGKFNVTAKGGRIEAPFFDARIALPYLVVAAANVAGIASGIARVHAGTPELDSVVVNVAWAALNVLTLLAAAAAACERRELRTSPRVGVSLPAMLRVGGRTFRARTVDLARGGARVTAALGAHAVSRGERVWLSVFCGAEEHPLPADVASRDADTLRLRFPPLSIADEARLVEIVFSRADAWLRRGDLPPDRPLRALGSVAWHGLAGGGRALGLVVRRPRRPAAEVPATARSGS
jgi:cellulose synthase (UDP-forming)